MTIRTTPWERETPSPTLVGMGAAKARRKALRALLIAGKGSTQGQLCDLLDAQGFSTTQSTVSRDLKLLGAERRLRDDGEFMYRLPDRAAPRFPGDMVVSVEHNGHLIVVRTRVGRAQAVGLELDALRHPDLLGTLAGDDTVLVIPRSVGATASLARRLRELADLID